MADKVPITVSLYGFEEEQASIMQASFTNADKWSSPWKLCEQIEDACVIIVNLGSENDYETIEKLKKDFQKAEIVAFAPKKPPKAKWHLVRQPSGKAPIVQFSQLVLKISHSLKRNVMEPNQPQENPIVTLTTESSISADAEPDLQSDEKDFDQESDDFLPFFNTLDSLLDSKPHEKRKRFNES